MTVSSCIKFLCNEASQYLFRTFWRGSQVSPGCYKQLVLAAMNAMEDEYKDNATIDNKFDAF